MNVTTAPGPAIYVTNTSSALFGLCGWTSEDAVCYGTVIPIFVSFLLLVLILARQLMITPQHSAVQTVILPKDSPLLPDSFRFFDAAELNQLISGVSDMPLKTFLPRIGLAELVEPSATLGIANVKDLLRANRLALRDIGIGPRETRLFSRALERRVRLREKMQEVFLSSSTRHNKRHRAPTLTQRSREAVAKSLRARRAAAGDGGNGGASSPTESGLNASVSLVTPRANASSPTVPPYGRGTDPPLSRGNSLAMTPASPLGRRQSTATYHDAPGNGDGERDGDVSPTNDNAA
jgi:hypothetical protein